MDFDSHTSGVVTSAVALLNAVTPGWSRGREYQPPASDGLAESVRDALATGESRFARLPSGDEAAELADSAARLRAVFDRLDAGDMDGACGHVNTLLADTGAVPVLSNHDGGPWHLHFHAMDAGYARGWAASMATALAIILGNPHADRLGVCSAQACDRVYVDTSRNGTRRFCSTSCQNRVKAAEFRRRKAT